MRLTCLGRVGQPGGVDPGVRAAGPDLLALVVRFRGRCTAVLIRVGPTSVRTAWTHDFGGVAPRTWGGHPVVINAASAALVGEGRLCLAGATERLLVAASRGEVLARSTGTAPPSAPGTVRDGEFVVPECQTLAIYDASRLTLSAVRPIPAGAWAFAPPSGDWVPIQTERGQGLLWGYRNDTLWDLPGVLYPICAAVDCGSSILVPSGGCPPSGGVGLDPTTGEIKWRVGRPTHPQSRSPTDRPGILRDPILSFEGRAIMAHSGSVLESLDSADGTSHWRVEFTADIAAIGRADEVVWVGTTGGGVTALNARSGTVLGGAESLHSIPVSILTQDEPTNSRAVLVVSHRGDVYRCTL